MQARQLKNLVLVLTGLSVAPSAFAHHEAIFGPQSTTLISSRRFLSTQYYYLRKGRAPAPSERSNVGVLTAGAPLGKRWSLSLTLPFEGERNNSGAGAAGVQDVVVGVRFFPYSGPDDSLMAVLTLEPPTGNLEHDALGVGGGALYRRERGHWSAVSYGLARTEHSFDAGERRGDRLFLGGGVAYEHHGLPFSPQLGFSWEQTGRRKEVGARVPGSNTAAFLLHPTLIRTFRNEAVQAFFVVSVPVAQSSGSDGWQGFRIAAGLVWNF